MKKLLSILAAFGLTAVTATSVVACSTGAKYTAVATIKKQNFYLWGQLANLKSGDKISQAHMIANVLDSDNSGKKLIFSNGLYNKYVKSDSLAGTINSENFGFIDQLNNSGILGNKKLAINANIINENKTDYDRYSEFESNIDQHVENADQIENIKINSVTGGFKYDGEPSTDEVTGGTAIAAFNSILNTNGDTGKIESSFKNGAYWVGIKLENNGIVDKDWRKQVIKLSNVGTIYDSNTHEDYLDELIKSVEHKLDDTLGDLNNENWRLKTLLDEDYLDIPAGYSIKSVSDLVRALILKNVDLFNMGYQKYDNSIEINCYNLMSQARNYIADKGYEKDITDAINKYNQHEFAGWTAVNGETFDESLNNIKSKLILGPAKMINAKGEPASSNSDINAMNSGDWIANTFKISSQKDWNSLLTKTIKFDDLPGNRTTYYTDGTNKDVKGPDSTVDTTDPSEIKAIIDSMIYKIKNSYFNESSNKIISEVKKTIFNLVSPENSNNKQFDSNPDRVVLATVEQVNK